MKVTQFTKDVLASRRQRRELLKQGFEEIAENGGRLWEIYRGDRVGQHIVDCEIARNGLSIFVRIE